MKQPDKHKLFIVSEGNDEHEIAIFLANLFMPKATLNPELKKE